MIYKNKQLFYERRIIEIKCIIHRGSVNVKRKVHSRVLKENGLELKGTHYTTDVGNCHSERI